MTWLHWQTCKTLFLLCYLLFTVELLPVQPHEENNKLEAVLKPDDPVVEIGGTLILNCTLNGSNETFNSRSIFFVSKGINYTSGRHVSFLSDRTAQLKLTHLNSSNSGIYACRSARLLYLGKHSKQSVVVTRVPLKPKLDSCRIKEMKYMNCSWFPSFEQQADHTMTPGGLKQQLQVVLTRNNTVITSCSGLSYSICVFPLTKIGYDPYQSNEDICVIISARNNLQKPVFSNKRCFKAYDIINPEAPESFTMTHVDEGCLLKWHQPFNYRYIKFPLMHYITMESHFKDDFHINKQPVEMYEVVNVTSLLYTSCHPYVTYSGHIVSKLQIGGYQSGMLNFTFTTRSTVPCQSVEISPYEVFIDYDKLKILVYWKPVSERNYCGPGFEYALMKKLNLYDADSHTSNDLIFLNTSDGSWSLMPNIITSNSFFSFDVPTSCILDGCDFSILAKNNIGVQNENLSVFKWPKKESAPRNILLVNNLIVEKSETNVFFSWEVPNKRNASNVSNITTILYWCSTLAHDICSQNLNLKPIEAPAHQYNLTYRSTFINEFTYGIGIFVDGYGSNIVWSNKVYDYSGMTQAPSQVTVKEAKNGLTVYWSFHQDKCQDCSYVRHFIIYYCPTVDHTLCSDNVTEFKVSLSTRMFDVPNTKADDFYLFWMASSSRASLSAFTEPILIKFSWIDDKFIVLFVILAILLGVVIFYSTYKIYRMYIKCQKKFLNGLGIDVPQNNLYVSYRQTVGTRLSGIGNSQCDPPRSNGKGSRKSKKEQTVKNNPKCSSYQNNHQLTAKVELSSSSSMSPNYFEFSRLLSSISENCDNEAECQKDLGDIFPANHPTDSEELFGKSLDESYDLHMGLSNVFESLQPLVDNNTCQDHQVLFDSQAAYSKIRPRHSTTQDAVNFPPLFDDAQLRSSTFNYNFNNIHDNSDSHFCHNIIHDHNNSLQLNFSSFDPTSGTLKGTELPKQSSLDPISEYCQLPGIDHFDSGMILSANQILYPQKSNNGPLISEVICSNSQANNVIYSSYVPFSGNALSSFNKQDMDSDIHLSLSGNSEQESEKDLAV